MTDPVPADAFGALGNETRTRVVRALAEADEPMAFSALHEASGEDTSAGFAYHLRQLDGRYVRETDEGYVLTYAGREAARDLAAGTYTESHELDPVALDDDCPLCGTPALEIRGSDNVLGVVCADCGGEVCSLPFPPGGLRTHEETDLPRAFDAHHRHRISMLSRGTCPECGGHVARDLSTGREFARAGFECAACGYDLQCPVTLTVLDHPAVVALYHEHGVDVRERPIWNVGGEWRERCVSTDPPVVRVSTRVDDEVLALYVGRDATVGHTERWTAGQTGNAAA